MKNVGRSRWCNLSHIDNSDFWLRARANTHMRIHLVISATRDQFLPRAGFEPWTSRTRSRDWMSYFYEISGAKHFWVSQLRNWALLNIPAKSLQKCFSSLQTLFLPIVFFFKETVQLIGPTTSTTNVKGECVLKLANSKHWKNNIPERLIWAENVVANIFEHTVSHWLGKINILKLGNSANTESLGN